MLNMGQPGLQTKQTPPRSKIEQITIWNVVANYLSPKAILQADFIHFITLLMNLISQWNQSEFHSDPRLLPGQSGKLSKNDQKDSKYCVGLKTCEPDLNITNVREALKNLKFKSL